MLYDKGISSGATGGKLLGAGGSGYFAFYVPPNASDQFTAHFPHELDFHITHQGAGVIHES
jgi:D-glycero-alpha-D-manno-heptose-7-phosphate kinase